MSNKLMSRVGNGYVQWDDAWKMGTKDKGKLYPNYSNVVDSGLAWCIQEMRRRVLCAGSLRPNSGATDTDSEYRWEGPRDGGSEVHIEIFEPLVAGPL